MARSKRILGKPGKAPATAEHTELGVLRRGDCYILCICVPSSSSRRRHEVTIFAILLATNKETNGLSDSLTTAQNLLQYSSEESAVVLGKAVSQ